MTSRWSWIALAVLCAVAMGAELRIDARDGSRVDVSIGVGEAVAAPRNVVRRTSRRTSRRTVRRLTALPAGCPLTGRYYYCGGVYYNRVVEGGQTYYVVVTP